MPSIGRHNTLTVVKEVDFGAYLDGGDMGEILLPKRYLPTKIKPGLELKVFLYNDSEDRIIATTESPKAVVGECAALKVVEVNNVGAFLDWGLPKDLLLPFNEQDTRRAEVGDIAVVYVYLDEDTNRIACSMKLSDFLHETTDAFKYGEEVDLLIAKRTPLGFKAIINGAYLGVIYEQELSRPLKTGERRKGYIKKPRADGRLDVSVTPLTATGQQSLGEEILTTLRNSGGSLPLSDKSSPDAIYAEFKVSKGAFKKAIGGLYKSKLIVIGPKGIALPYDDELED